MKVELTIELKEYKVLLSDDEARHFAQHASHRVDSNKEFGLLDAAERWREIALAFNPAVRQS